MTTQVLLKIDSGPRRGKTLLLERPGSYRFGRADECFEITPNEDPLVGRLHFAIEIDSKSVTIHDLGSRNGTTVNGTKLPTDPGGTGPARPSLRPLADGDLIGAGNTVFSVRLLSPLACSQCDRPIGGASIQLTVSPPPGVVCQACFQGRTPDSAESSGVCSRCGRPSPAQHLSRTDEGQALCASCQEQASLHLKSIERRMTQLAAADVPRGGRPLPIEQLEIKKTLGSGLASTVYLAFSNSEKREVALKVIRPQARLEEKSRLHALQRLREAERLHHPRIVQLLDFALDDGSIYCVLDYYPLGSLHSLIHSRGGTLGQQEAVPLLADALNGLTHAHSLGILHGGLKPTDLLLKIESGRVKADLSDFFNPVWPHSKTVRDRPHARASALFQPPAQISNQELNPEQLDIWRTGAIFYYALTGDPPLASPNPPLTPISLRQSSILPPLARIIDRALGADAQLYSSAAQMLSDVQIVLKSHVRLTIIKSE